MSVHDGVEEQVASGIRRCGVRGDDCSGVGILDGVVRGELCGGVFPNQALGGRLASECRKLVDSLVDDSAREEREGMLDHGSLAVRPFLPHIDAKSGIFVAHRIPIVDICGRGNKDGSADDGFPGAAQHPIQGCRVKSRGTLQVDTVV